MEKKVIETESIVPIFGKPQPHCKKCNGAGRSGGRPCTCTIRGYKRVVTVEEVEMYHNSHGIEVRPVKVIRKEIHSK